MFDIEDYDYNLPEKLIAQVPSPDRDASRLMVVERSRRSLADRRFSDLPELLRPGDLVVVNNTRVMPAKLIGRKESGGRVELLVLEPKEIPAAGATIRWCLLRSSKRPKKGSRLFFENQLTGVVEALGSDGMVQVLFDGPQSLEAVMNASGLMPLPHYIKREEADIRAIIDRERYQTVYSTRNGAVAAPTAGLHFTKPLMERLRKAGVQMVDLTLHVGHGTFRPVRARDIRDHVLGEEVYIVDEETASAVNLAKKEGRRVIAVGTTVVRVLETVADARGEVAAGRGRTNLLITPGFSFRVVEAMITNLHLPRSSLLFLVCAFAGKDIIWQAYGRAVEKGYHFYSYGDAMLIG
jgi:S-adenosylmethionine:tRNA ribosyltransferase-isomerase